MDFADCKARLSEAGVLFDVGLTSKEFSTIENNYSFTFPPDLREFLAFALPVSEGWIDWRNGDRTQILERLDWPLEGMCFDIENNAFWMEVWGPKPTILSDALNVARSAVEKAPRLIPICGHRYLPDRPSERGNPVFSVHQTDIIYYGSNLSDYLANEFLLYFNKFNRTVDGPIRRIDFWSDIVDMEWDSC